MQPKRLLLVQFALHPIRFELHRVELGHLILNNKKNSEDDQSCLILGNNKKRCSRWLDAV